MSAALVFPPVHETSAFYIGRRRPPRRSLAKADRSLEVFFCDATRQAFHSRPSRSFSKNPSCLFAPDDRASRRSLQKSLSRNSSAPPGTLRHETTRFSFYLIGLGRDGSRRPQCRQQARALL